jgi:hypothetical protein
VEQNIGEGNESIEIQYKKYPSPNPTQKTWDEDKMHELFR